MLNSRRATIFNVDWANKEARERRQFTITPFPVLNVQIAKNNRPNLLWAKLQAKASDIKQFGRLFSA